MSKYRIELTASRILPLLEISWGAVLLVSIWCWQDNILAAQVGLQVGASVALFGLLFYLFKRALTQQVSGVFMLDDEGRWSPISPYGMCAWQIHTNSKVLGFLACLVLVDKHDSKRKKRIWLAKDQMQDGDFRRLCRTIYRIHCTPQSI
ncbi:protein YgfX [Aliiglaciecola sp. LCG003]|uniref:protein YgfX n=1 Tax=Aliiglaciecola sp. LCG003 TaxID=3053655 RepID=UPI0025742941|nr:protein YgfX [Aliiglaciecola sp. LCG003]WJG10485.1 protein YgfX [Aliiglaciecola sp. LCG003]